MLFTARWRRGLGALVVAGALSPLAAVPADAASGPVGAVALPPVTLPDVTVPDLVIDPGTPGVTATDQSQQQAVVGTRAAAYPVADTFALHSSPSSAKVIYLDFDGETVGPTAYDDRTEGRQPAFSTDADPATFTAGERTQVQEVWQSVAEDFAAFDVDVTTEAPPAWRITRSSASDEVYGTRVLITGSRTVRSSADDAVCGTTCGGLAYPGVFDQTSSHEAYQPAWVFPENLGDTSKSIAESAAHEAGHTLGLRHDGKTGTDYYAGHASWGPVMGGPYNKPVTQWSRGDYAGATNGEDDLAVIASHGVARRADDAVGTVAGAAALPASSGAPAATGIISDQADVDAFGIGPCSGPVTVTAAPAAYGADLDLRLRILDAAGRELAANDTPTTYYRSDVATGLDARASVDVASGTALYVAVEGVGSGANASVGYTDYGSLGRYTIATTGCRGTDPAAAPATVPGAPTSVVAQATGGGTARVSWAAPASNGGRALTSYLVSVGPTDVVVTGDATSASVGELAPGSTYPVSVRAVNALGAGQPGEATLTNIANATSGAGLTTRSVPVLRGSTVVGKTLRISAGSYDRPVVTTVRWLAGGKAVGKGLKLKVAKAQVGQKVTAKVTVRPADGTPVVTKLTSRQVRPATRR